MYSQLRNTTLGFTDFTSGSNYKSIFQILATLTNRFSGNIACQQLLTVLTLVAYPKLLVGKSTYVTKIFAHSSLALPGQ
jgi:hypothetical protein